MRSKRTLAVLSFGLALLGLGLWRFKEGPPQPAAQAPAQHWVCPMRCLNGKQYDHAGKCPVCHMDLKPIAPHRARTTEGVEAWPRVQGKTAIYFRPYSVAKVSVEHLLRLAGKVSKDRLHVSAALPEGEALPPSGSSAMISPAEGYFRPIFGSVARSAGKQVSIVSPRRLDGFEHATVEVRLASQAVLAVPVEAVHESEGRAWAFRQGANGFEAVPVTLGERGERFVEVTQGLALGDVVAAAGVFWLEAQWRLDHPEKSL